MMFKKDDLKMETVKLGWRDAVEDQLLGIAMFWDITILSYHRVGLFKYVITYVDNAELGVPYDAKWGLNQ